MFSSQLPIFKCFSFVSSINLMKETQSPKRLRKPATTSIIQRKSSSKTMKFIRRSQPIMKIRETRSPNYDDDGDAFDGSTPTSSPSSFWEKSPILTRDFYQIDALDLAPLLLGKYLKRDEVVLQITEVEAYRPNDSACHGRFGITARTAPVFGPGGHAYVYLCYGLHTMLNIVADKEGAGAAVLIRSCAPISGYDTMVFVGNSSGCNLGLEIIKQRRGIMTEKPILLTGPGKVGQALGISTEWSNHSLFTPGGLELLDGPLAQQILVGPRVGIEYALPEHVNALWRFAIAGTPWFLLLKFTALSDHCVEKPVDHFHLLKLPVELADMTLVEYFDTMVNR